MHFRKAMSPDHFGADDFVDREFNPIQKTLTIKSVFLAKPPNGKKERICIGFEEDPRTAFFANSQVRTIAKSLRRADTDQWIGAKLAITSHEVKSPAGGMTTGMNVVSAVFPKAPAVAPNA
jgi:hypothetical protein